MINPYRFSDSELLKAAWEGKWGDEFDLVQMVIMHFTRLRETGDAARFDGIYFMLVKIRQNCLSAMRLSDMG